MRWSYKTIRYELKKEGLLGSAFLDEPEIELSLNQYGKAGWELVSLLETMDGLIAVFKQPLDLDTRSAPSPAKSSSENSSLPAIEIERKTQTFEPKLTRKPYPVRQEEDVTEAMMLDEFEVVEERVGKAAAKPVATPVDAGLIRIE